MLLGSEKPESSMEYFSSNSFEDDEIYEGGDDSKQEETK